MTIDHSAAERLTRRVAVGGTTGGQPGRDAVTGELSSGQQPLRVATWNLW